MKMNNFRRFDPEYTREGRVGLQRGNKDEEAVWEDFASDPEMLARVANAIRTAIEGATPEMRELTSVLGNDGDAIEAMEGSVLTRMHRIRERSSKLVEQKKSEALRKFGCLKCEACGFDFTAKYGSAGRGIIDIHHLRPVHTLRPGDTTKLSDLAMLCANCHRVVHSKRKWLTLEQLQQLLSADAGG
ncbi:HNH endonuclease [Dyella terrae]|uniref:HNH endonuclease n=1 Tax=Dyella terrae TaxID=522259 RepID=UPI001EFCDE1B|nr:HNH endonuclease [Dyella terrae]